MKLGAKQWQKFHGVFYKVIEASVSGVQHVTANQFEVLLMSSDICETRC